MYNTSVVAPTGPLNDLNSELVCVFVLLHVVHSCPFHSLLDHIKLALF